MLPSALLPGSPLGTESYPPKFMSQEITEPIADGSRGIRARRYHVLRQVHNLMSQKRFYPLFVDGKEATKKNSLEKRHNIHLGLKIS